MIFSVTDDDIQPVSCSTGDIRLVGGVLDNEGRLEVCINQQWGSVCSISWGSTDTTVACRQLGYQELGIYKIYADMEFIVLVYTGLLL